MMRMADSAIVPSPVICPRDDEWLAARLRLQVAADEAVSAPPSPSRSPCFHTPRPVARVDATSLSLGDFVQHFALRRAPVVLTNLACTQVPWTLAHVAATAAGVRFTSRRRVPGSSEWAQVSAPRHPPARAAHHLYVRTSWRKAASLLWTSLWPPSRPGRPTATTSSTGACRFTAPSLPTSSSSPK